MSDLRVRVVRVLTYDGPPEHIDTIMQKNWVKERVVMGKTIITETVLTSLFYDYEQHMTQWEAKGVTPTG